MLLKISVINVGEVWYSVDKQEGAEFVTGDKEFKQVEDEIKIVWL